MDATHCPGCLERDARIATLEAQVAELQAQLRDLTKPPTKPRLPAVFVKAPGKTPTGKKPGGQPGHPPHLKQLLPPERVDKVVPYVPAQCQHCQTPLPQAPSANDPPPSRHQVAELPEVAARITEYQGQ